MPTDDRQNPLPLPHEPSAEPVLGAPAAADRLDPARMLSTAALDRRAVDRERTDLRPSAQRSLVLRGGRLPMAAGRLVLADRAALGSIPQDPARPEVYLGEIPAETDAPDAAVLDAEDGTRPGRWGVTVVSLDLSHTPLQDSTHGVVDETQEPLQRIERAVERAARETGAGEVQWTDLRHAAASLLGTSAVDASLAVAAQAITAWHLDHPRCPRCGDLTEVGRSGWLRRCPQDGSMHFPRTDPAVIVTVTDGEPGSEDERLLLGRAAAWPEHRYSTLAGFVEPGESFELAVVREIREESGAIVGDVRCLGSQPWPFPRSLMIGCTARLLGGDVAPDGEEIVDLRWFTRRRLREAVDGAEIRLPGRISIARALIEHWYGGDLPESDW